MEKQRVYTRDILELSFLSELGYNNPYLDGEITVVFYSPDGTRTEVKGFWDGGASWKVRFAPSISGMWKWESKAADTRDTGLNGKTGVFEVVEYNGSNPILKHGFLKVTGNGRGFSYEDGKPFFWLGDTAWSISAKATVEEWQEAAKHRSSQGFNVVNINTLPQCDASVGADLRRPFAYEGNVLYWDKPNFEYFQYLDHLMHITQQAGMFTAMVALWFDYVPGTNPLWPSVRKEGLTPELASAYGSYLAARYAAYGTIWVISGDSDFESSQTISIYDSTAYAIKKTTPYLPLITAHLHGSLATPENLNEKDWLTFHMYQSSHVHDGLEISIRCAETDRAYMPKRPVLNGEPCYENICFYKLEEKISRELVREVMWKSIITGANAGITYGAHGIWSFHREGEQFNGGQDWGIPVSWREALNFEGSYDAARMKEFFEELPWWELEPVSHELKLCEYPDCMAAATPDRSIIVVYVPKDKKLKMYEADYSKYTYSWYNPVTGERKTAKPEIVEKSISLGVPPWENDAIMLLTHI